MRDFLDFEKPLKELEERIEKVSKSSSEKKGVPRLLRMLQGQLAKKETEIFGNLTPWQQAQLARHPQRPSALKYIETFCQDFVELHGDRTFGDDQAIVGGLATFGDRTICVIGQEKGQGVKARVKRNFGMPNPEGYRKALRIMKLAEKFDRPIVTFIDTPGAYPGVGAEERGQAEAIARNLFVMARLQVPIVAVITGEGGSGGALALGVADRVLILENSIYSVISPEGCAAILWNDPAKTAEAAAALKMNGAELLKLGIVDEVIPEPIGGAHRDPDLTAQHLSKSIQTHLKQLESLKKDKLVAAREEKFRRMSALADS
ncbi:acetyl-CoA carboxylase carboxyltransferase subunit alpha [Candidatus Nitronereus thalassa]|uniref:Acetyl-coenzyme A carboxylase carboxyl transferase subunit alpha n=1 Tax=Candidatus Nitronereus thalassa TaxID=3020898 RepID=A0ABU3K6Q7_9BACT|nr:acetyl-CoA carboxylase carboxyltransferase subunit alpha [Candidatus Nitronereus thalassa]MDT7042056.1 acetyl-CoA carboxylase carboxyltransferase subunit alpha [Candidatus Nitronereus thalassa]